ncbi:MAG: M20/M25/M40 family metallo-hydrolase [Clostridia bacterium]|nr:M20/M25/M40 family metallo-hydrolase [Clostridia bacterium]
MNTEKLFEEIDRLNDKYIGFLQDVIRLESPTSSKSSVDECGNYFIKKAKELGFKVTTAPMEKSGDAVSITLNPDVDAKPVCISGHIDTVHPVGFFGDNPIRFEGDKMFGPGSGDCKGGVVAGFCVLEALKNIGFNERPVKLILQTDEENSSATSDKATVKFICEEAKDAVALLNVEPAKKANDVIIERKGILKYSINIKGVSSHASICFREDVASAVAEAAHKIIEIEKYKNKDGITANVGLINGGTAINTVPAECNMSIDFRYKTEEQFKEIENFIENLCKKSYLEGTVSTVSLFGHRLSMPLCEKNTNLLKNSNEALKKAGLEPLVPAVTYGGSDAADFTNYGIPVLDQLGVISIGAHTINEHMLLSSFAPCAKRLVALAALL